MENYLKISFKLRKRRQMVFVHIYWDLTLVLLSDICQGEENDGRNFCCQKNLQVYSIYSGPLRESLSLRFHWEKNNKSERSDYSKNTSFYQFTTNSVTLLSKPKIWPQTWKIRVYLQGQCARIDGIRVGLERKNKKKKRKKTKPKNLKHS